MAEGEVAALKEALCNQYIIMKKLYAEIEEERDASATAASEALSMILRLQREKAAEKMESCQYKRMAEERIYHAEESLEILEEVIQQRDMEIISLQYQLGAYKQKLSSLGIITPDFGEMILGEKESSRGTNAVSSKASFNGPFRRHFSLPSLGRDEFWFLMGFHGDEYPASPSGRSIWRRIGEFRTLLFPNKEKDASELLKSGRKYQAHDVNKMVKELTQVKNSADAGSGPSVASNEGDYASPVCSIGSWFPAVSDTSSNSTQVGKAMKSEDEFTCSSPSRSDDNESNSYMLRESCKKSWYSAFVHDIHEVPESHKGSNPGKPCNKFLQNSMFKTKNMIEMPEFMPKETVDYLYKNDECLNKAFMGKHNGSKFSMPGKRSLIHHGRKISNMKKGNTDTYPLALLEFEVGTAISQPDLEQLGRRLQQLEDEWVTMQEDTERGKEQLKLLRELFKQLNTTEAHRKRSISRKSSPMEESSLASIMEAVLSFSI